MSPSPELALQEQAVSTRPRWPAPDRMRAIGASLAIGAFAVVFGQVLSLAPMAVAILATTPLLLWATLRWPELVVWTIAFSQIFEVFELSTPVGTVSLSIIALIVFLAPRIPRILRTMLSPGYVIVVAFLVAYVIGQAVQFLHGDAGVAIRHLITASSFVAYVLLGIYIGARRPLLAAAAFGSAAALMTLASLALLANLGIVLVAASQGPPRAIFGIVSPFFRTYGIDTATIGFFLPLSVPWLVLTTRLSCALPRRVAAVLTLIVIWLASLLLFQSRSMVLEVPIGILLAWSLSDRRYRTGVILVGSVAGAALVAGLALSVLPQVVSAPQVVSTQLRTDSYVLALAYLVQHPDVLLIGTNPEQFRQAINAGLTYGSQIPAGAPIHNLLVETLIAGGIVSAAGLIALVLYPALGIFQHARRVGQFGAGEAFALSALVVAVVEAMVTPGIANSGLFWTTLGVAIALAAGRVLGIVPGYRQPA